MAPLCIMCRQQNLLVCRLESQLATKLVRLAVKRQVVCSHAFHFCHQLRDALLEALCKPDCQQTGHGKWSCRPGAYPLQRCQWVNTKIQ